MALGQSFGVTPAGMEEQAQRTRKRLPTQQALKTLTLALPKTLGGAEGLAPNNKIIGAYSPGGKFSGGIPDSSAAQMQRMVRAMSGRQPGSARPAPPRFQGGGVTTPTPAAPPPPKATVAAPKPQQAKPQQAKPQQAKPQPAPAPIQPQVVGGGLVDEDVSPPPQQAPVGPTGPPPGSGAPPQYGGQGTPYNDANGGGSGGYYWDANQGKYVQGTSGSATQGSAYGR